jgi:hypothetical protein
MKITREDLIHIIKEELESVTGLQEQEAQEGEEVVQKAMQIKDDPKAQALYAKLDNNPEVQAALQRVMAELPQEAALQEKISAPKGYVQTGAIDHYPERDPSYKTGFETGKLAASPNQANALGGLGVPGAAMATAWAAGGGLTKGAGAALVTALIPALGLTGATLATGGIAIAAPLALGYLLDVMADPRHKIKEK